MMGDNIKQSNRVVSKHEKPICFYITEKLVLMKLDNVDCSVDEKSPEYCSKIGF